MTILSAVPYTLVGLVFLALIIGISYLLGMGVKKLVGDHDTSPVFIGLMTSLITITVLVLCFMLGGCLLQLFGVIKGFI
jgi:hypothetical protein